jgi:enoyl-[acyl-carrier protein] reductase I
MSLLASKQALIVGVASDRSIATGIARSFHREGAKLAFTYQSERLKDRVIKIAEENGSNAGLCFPCDLTSDESIADLLKNLQKKWQHLDIVVHSAAFAPMEQLDGNYIDTVTREGFKVAHDISSYSFTALAKAARPMMKNKNGSLLTLTYLGSERTFPSYNVMGLAKASLEANVRYLAANLGPEKIRVNAISAGVIRTLAASGIKGLRKMIAYAEKTSPLKQCTTIDEVGDAAAFLCSDLARAVTGQVLYVDGGFNIVGIPESALEESEKCQCDSV